MTDTNIPTSVVLDRAADLIQERGWVGHDAPPCYDAWGWASNTDGALCLEGALYQLLGRPAYWASTEINKCPAAVAVKEHLETERDLWTWNDQVGRTAAEVIEVLRATAIIEAARERADVHEVVPA